MTWSTHYHRASPRLRVICALAGVVVALVLSRHPSALADPTPPQATANEANLKLARLYATAKFISWPDEATSPGTPFVIGVIEPNPFGAGLQKLADRKLKDRPIRVIQFKTPGDYKPCHLLFIPDGAPSETVRSIVEQSRNAPTLVWRESPAPASEPGTACSFVRSEDGLFIEADPAELKRRALVPDGRLLSLNLVRIIKHGK